MMIQSQDMSNHRRQLCSCAASTCLQTLQHCPATPMHRPPALSRKTGQAARLDAGAAYLLHTALSAAAVCRRIARGVCQGYDELQWTCSGFCGRHATLAKGQDVPSQDIDWGVVSHICLHTTTKELSKSQAESQGGSYNDHTAAAGYR